MEVSNKGCLSVPQAKCLHCSHLVLFDFKGAKEEDCTVENGNDQCPAQGVMVVLGVNVEKASSSIIRAFLANDAADISAKMQKLSGYHETVQQQVMDKVKEGLLLSAMGDSATAPKITETRAAPTGDSAPPAAATGGEAAPAGEEKPKGGLSPAAIEKVKKFQKAK